MLQSRGVIVNEFEAVTALGMEIFAREKCEIVVLETGLGGKWDATNVIEAPLCTVITSIGFDHTAVLGNTISEITTEKCGIIKENGITVTAPQRSKAVEIIRKKAKDKNNIIFFAQDVELDDIEYSIRKTYFTYKGERFSLNLLGSYQIINVKTVFATLSALNVTKKLGFKITLESVHKGLDEAVHLARFQVYSLYPLIIVDGAHNPDGTAQLAKTLHKLLPDEKPIALCGMMADKKIENSLVNLKGVFSKIYTVTVDNPRTATDEAVSKIFMDMGQDAIMCGNVEEGFIAGAYHPAFREMCESRLYFDYVSDIIKKENIKGKITIYVNPSEISKMTGQKKCNILKLRELGAEAKVKGSEAVEKYKAQIKCEE